MHDHHPCPDCQQQDAELDRLGAQLSQAEAARDLVISQSREVERRLREEADDAHVRAAADQDEHSAQRAALVAENERLRGAIQRTRDDLLPAAQD